MSITNPPSTQEIIAAGPAVCAASSEPKSHPDPMIDPSEKKSSPNVLTSLFSLRSVCAPPRSSVCVAITNPPLPKLPSQVDTQLSRRLPSRPCRAISLGDDRLYLPSYCKAVSIVGHQPARSKCPRGPGLAV